MMGNDPLQRLMQLHHQQGAMPMQMNTPQAQQDWQDYLQSTQDKEPDPSDLSAEEGMEPGPPSPETLLALRRLAR